MFLAASPYFQHRFRTSPALLSSFPSALISVSCVTNLVSMLLLTHLQSRANYPNRIILSLVLNIVAFILLALSTVTFRNVSPGVYFVFLMAIVFTASLATGFCQNGVFAYVSGFGVGEYTQAIMTGQGVAGVLPCIAQIVSVLSVKDPDTEARKDGSPVPQESGKSAFAYFLTATAVSVAALLAFFLLLRRHPEASTEPKSPLLESEDPEPAPPRKVVGMWTLFKKLRYLASAVFLTFAITMFFPVFTQQITSVRPADTAPRILQPACFIPLAFLLWNAGDLAGRLVTLNPRLTLIHWPRTVFLASIARGIFIPLYLLCNIHGRGAAISSDIFYLVIVQFFFGLSNGYLGSTCMMGAGEWVDVEEREAAGGFMGLMLVFGLTAGSLLSFAVA
jgi:equilibrative nucleoside transporter 1/2/3